MALFYAKKMGWPIIPLHSIDSDGKCTCGNKKCSSPGKHPMVKSGINNASTEIEEIKKFWKKNPNANIGIATGKKKIVVLDIDGEEGERTLHKLKKKYGRLPKTLKIKTGNGYHYYFSSEIEIKNSVGKIGPKIDFRGEKGYIVAPPSDHINGRKYKFLKGKSPKDIKIAPIPEWLLKLANQSNSPSSSDHQLQNNMNLPIKHNETESILKGKRNDTLFKFGCSLKGKGNSDQTIKKTLRKVNRKKCNPRLSINDVNTICNSIAKYPNKEDVDQLKVHINEWFKAKGDDITINTIMNDDALLSHLSNIFRKSKQDYMKIKGKLKNKGFTVRDLDDLQKVVINHKKNQVASINKDGLPISLFLDNLPVSASLLIPNGFVIDKNGIRKEIRKDDYEKIITTSPIIISNRFKNIQNRKQLVTLIFLENELWEKLTVTKSHISEPQKLVSLADNGLPVTINNAREVIDFLYLFQSINKVSIPVSEIVSRLGWVGDNFDKGFMYGTYHIPPTGKGKLRNANLQNSKVDQEIDYPPVYFYNSDNGGNSIAAGFSKKGKKKEWLKLIPIIEENAVLAFMMYGAVTAPLLCILDYQNILIDNSGPTTEGKTTGMQVSISVFGDPQQLISTWNNTQVYVERTAQMLNGLPFILDDTKLIKDANLISKIIYQSAAGQGRGRGTIDGTAEVARFNTVILSTGESNILNLINASDGGAHGRVIPVCKTPFPIKNKQNKRIIDKINKITSKNHGVIGIKYIRYILKNKEKWSSWKKEVEKIKAKYDSKSNDGIMYRLNTSFAAIEFAAKIFCEACELDLDYQKHMNEIYQIVSHEVFRNANLSQNALQELFDFCISHQDDFYQVDFHNDEKSDEKSDDVKRQPPRGWLGSWEKKLAIIPENLKNFLKKKGYEPDAIIDEWEKNKVFEKLKSGGNPKVTIGGIGRVRCYTFKDSVTKKYISKNNSKSNFNSAIELDV